MKLCKDCRYCRLSRIEGSEYQYAKCEAPAARKEPVGGTSRWKYCEIVRDDSFPLDLMFGTCGKRARWFELKSAG